MCGICGIYHFERSRHIDEQCLRRMASVLQHRGPDGEGFYVDTNLGLGHRRLSIIDLTQQGQQPMRAETDCYWITYNGEIYNYLELRQRLIGKGHQFHSHSDTEVVLHLYEEEGPACVEHLNGMFAFAIWDSEKRTLFAARDRMGIKPFYYSVQDNTFIFASEIKALLQSELLTAELNPEGLLDYITFQFCLGEKTLFKHVERLLPGHWLLVKPDGTLHLECYWDISFEIDTDHTAEYFEHQLLRLLEDAVRLQLRADVPVGAHLSGGLDSSTVTMLASTLLGGQMHSFSGGFRESPEFDETPYARIVAERANTIHHEVFPDANDFVTALPLLIYHMDEPAAGPGLFPQFYVSKLASQEVKVVLGGQGGDEVFGGYTRYLIAYLEECIKGGIENTQQDTRYVVTFESILPNLVQLQGYQPLLKYFWEEGVFEDQAARYFRLIDRSPSIRHLLSQDVLDANSYNSFEAYRDVFCRKDIGSYINRMTHFDLKTQLPALLQVEDRTSMAVSLESRVPLLDYRIVELATAMPPIIKYNGGRSKHIFREVVRHVVPDEIYNRTDKMGFPVPLNTWYKTGPVREFALDTLLGESARSRGIFQPDLLSSVLNSERTYGRAVWGLLNLELWMETFWDSTPGSRV